MRRIGMRERRDRAEQAGVADQESSSFFQRSWMQAPQPVEIVEFGDVERHDRRLAAEADDLVIEEFERALPARQREKIDMRALTREGDGERAAYAARGAGDESDAAFERVDRCENILSARSMPGGSSRIDPSVTGTPVGNVAAASRR